MTIKTVFIVTSTIEVTEFSPHYEIVSDDHIAIKMKRSVFTPEERLRQLISSVLCLRSSCPDDPIIVVDSSKNAEKFKDDFLPFKDVEFVPLNSISTAACDISLTHPNPSAARAICLKTFFSNKKSFLSQYDFIVVITGRYSTVMNRTLFVEENRDKIFVKEILDKPLKRTELFLYGGTDIVPKQYSTQVFAFGNKKLDVFLDIFDSMYLDLTTNKILEKTCFDEDLLYYYTRPFVEDIIEIDWFTYGWSAKKGHPVYG
jgi:hypothetical protein